MRILYTHRTQGKGAEGAHVLGMFEAFAELGFEVAMDCLPGCNPAQPSPASPAVAPAASPKAEKPKPSVFQRIYWAIADHAPQVVFEGFELAYNFLLFPRIAYHIWRFKPDLVYERYALNTVAPALAARFFGLKHVLEVNDSVVIERSRPLILKGLATQLERFALNHCRLAITITEKFKSQLMEKFQLPPDRIAVFTNGVSTKRFKGPFRRDEKRNELGIHSGTVIGSTGQFLPWHGLQLCLETLGPLAESHDLHFVFVGDGPVKPELEATAHKLGIAARLHITGMVPLQEVPHWLSALDIAVIPAAAPHASPMKLMEYMAMGLPVLAPELPSIRAAMVNDDLGYVFSPEDSKQLKELALHMLEHGDEASIKGKAAQAHVLQHLTWVAHAREILHRLQMPLPKMTASSPSRSH